MRKPLAAAFLGGALFVAGGGDALAAPADQGNCISTRDNGGDAGTRISTWAGRGFGTGVADALGGGTIGSEARGASCRP